MTQSPKVRSPKVRSPEVRSPEVRSPEVRSPEVQPPAVPEAPAQRPCCHCGQLAPVGAPICGACRRVLARVCYGKGRLGQRAARIVAARYCGESKAYLCPLCRDWHVGRASALGAGCHAEATLIVLSVARTDRAWLRALAEAWAPEAAERTVWRAAVQARRPGRPHEAPDRLGT